MHVGVILGAVALIILILASWAGASSRSLRHLHERVEGSWRQIEVESHRRRQLIPMLIDAFTGRAPDEVVSNLVEARGRAQQARGSAADQARLEDALSAAVGRALATGECTPGLKASGPFCDIRAELAAIDDRISGERRAYNADVDAYNAVLETPSGAVVARIMDLRPAERFESTRTAMPVPAVAAAGGVAE